MRDLFSSIFNIFKYCGKILTAIRHLFFNLLFILAIIIAVIALIPKKKVDMPDNAILKLTLSGNIVEERKRNNPFTKIMNDPFQEEEPDKETVLQDVLDVITAAATDPKIVAILLDIDQMQGAGLNQLHTIGEALTAFKNHDKKVIAAEDFYTQAQYYLASYASLISVNPMGGVDLHGFGVHRLYFREALDKLEISFNIFKVGDFKSALEPFMRNDMSPEDRLQNNQWLQTLWGEYTGDVASQRHIPIGRIIDYSKNSAQLLKEVGGNPAQLAKKTGLVDAVWNRQEIVNFLKKNCRAIGREPTFVSYREYLDKLPDSTELGKQKQKVGLIIAEGNILPGKQAPGTIGGDSLASLIHDAQYDHAIRALVLRINSGGGSAFASEVIRQELLEFKKSGKPLVVSMGTMAASGGYWIAADADQIWAAPTTITGSIGIFGALPTFEKPLAKMGIHSDGTGTTPISAGINPSQPLPDELKEVIQQSIEDNYNKFINIVSTGRKMEASRVQQIAGGRVYDGTTAKEIGLVDNLGNTNDAIKAAARLAKLQDYSIEYLETPVSVKDQVLQLFSSFEGSFAEQNPSLSTWTRKLLHQLQTTIADCMLFGDPQGMYAHWMKEFSI